MSDSYTANDFAHDLGLVIFRGVRRGGQLPLTGDLPDAPIVARLGDRAYPVVGVTFVGGRVVVALADDRPDPRA